MRRRQNKDVWQAEDNVQTAACDTMEPSERMQAIEAERLQCETQTYAAEPLAPCGDGAGRRRTNIFAGDRAT